MGRTVKVVMIGASGTGKTSLRGQFMSGSFSASYRATIGTDFHAKMIPIPPKASTSGSNNNIGTNVNTNADAVEDGDSTPETSTPRAEESVSLQIWDTAGQERFSSLSSAFFRGADAVILVYDTARPETLEDLKRWWGSFADKCPVPPGEEASWPVAVVGNKIDLLKGGERPQDIAEEFVKRLIVVPEDVLVEADENEPGSELEEQVLTPRAQSVKINGVPNGTASEDENGWSRHTDPNGTFTSSRTTNTIYHTPSSSLHETSAHMRTSAASVASSIPLSMHTAKESASPSQERSERSWSRTRRGTLTSTSSSQPTITPSLFIRQSLEVDGDTTPTQLPPLEKGAKLFFSSAKTAEGVADIFTYIAARAVARMEWIEEMEALNLRIHIASNTPTATNHNRTILLANFHSELNKIQNRCCT